MTTQEIKPQEMPMNNSNRFFLKAKKHGFIFKATESEHDKRCKKKDDIIADIGEEPKPYKVIFSFAAILVALVFAYMEALNVASTIVGAIGINENAAILVGWAFASSGLLAGDMLVTSWRHDGFSKKPTPKFYIGLIFALVYLSGQYYLASRAGAGTGAEMQETVTTVKWYVVGLALLEIVFGMAFLSAALKTFTLFVANIRIKLTMKKMNRESRACEEAFRHYIYEMNGAALESETPAVKDAREFYANGGFYSETYLHSSAN